MIFCLFGAEEMSGLTDDTKKRLNGWAQVLLIAGIAGSSTFGGWMYMVGRDSNQIEQNTEALNNLREVVQSLKKDLSELARDAEYRRGLRERNSPNGS